MNTRSTIAEEHGEGCAFCRFARRRRRPPRRSPLVFYLREALRPGAADELLRKWLHFYAATASYESEAA